MASVASECSDRGSKTRKFGVVEPTWAVKTCEGFQSASSGIPI